MIKVLVVDDHPLIREGIRQILAKINDIILEDEASNTSECKRKLRDKTYDVILLDLSLPGESGLELLKELNKKYKDIKIIILSIHTEIDIIKRCFKLGVSGYITKEAAPEELIKAIRNVYLGGKYINWKIAETLSSYFKYENGELPHEKLSEREYEVSLLLASGKTNKEIAVDLSLSEKTISTYRQRILEKLNLKNNAEIIYYAIKNKLIKIEL